MLLVRAAFRWASRRPKWICALPLLCLSVTSSSAADKATIDKALGKAQASLKTQVLDAPTGVLASYALYKNGEPLNSPLVQKSVERIVKQVRAGEYSSNNNPQHQVYEATISLLLLEAAGPDLYPYEIDTITAYLLARQKSFGAWYYPNQGDHGDTSITQYGLLGLWAATRMGREVPRDVWTRAGRWLLDNQTADGAFSYHPHEKMPPTFSMTAAGTGSLMLIRIMLYGTSKAMDDAPSAAPSTPVISNRKRFGVLEPVVRPEPERPADAPAPTTVTASELDLAIRRGVAMLDRNFAADRYMAGNWTCYSMYSIERIGALRSSPRLVEVNWYDRGSDVLMPLQQPTGSWTDSNGPASSTSFAILFLTKATESVFKPPPKTVGGGLLIGGRGLPDDLAGARLGDANASGRKPRAGVDSLLSLLEKPVDIELPAVQTELVEAVQFSQAPELVGQVDRLKKLVDDPRFEVRRTALWALARSGDISVAPLLIRGLSDPSIPVVREASFGLCVLSRRPLGVGLPIEPLEGLSEEATIEQQVAHVNTWRPAVVKKWEDWYLKVRPYDERDDRNQIQIRRQ